MRDFDRLRNQARTERDFIELSEWCATRSRHYKAACAPLEAVEMAECRAELALRWNELAKLYADRAKALNDPDL